MLLEWYTQFSDSWGIQEITPFDRGGFHGQTDQMNYHVTTLDDKR